MCGYMEKYFIVEQKSLLSLLASMQPICTKRTTLDVTSCILFEAGHKELVLKSSDLEISLQASCMLNESTLVETERLLIPGKRIFDVIKELDGAITCTLKNNQLILNAGTGTLALNSKDYREFPPFPERIENLMHVDAPLFLKMLDGVAFLIPQSNANPALNGLLLEISPQELTMTATDGHCLSQVHTKKYTLAESKSWLLPRRAIFELKKILESYPDQTVFVGMCGNQLVFSGELFNFFTKLLSDTYPQYRPILERQAFTAAKVDRSRFIKTLRRSSCLLSGQFLATKFSFDHEALRVSLQNKDVGTMDEQLPLQGFAEQPLDVRFYAPYLLNGLQSFPEDQVTFYLKNSSKPIIFESSEPDLSMTYLVMPVAHVS